MAVHYKPISKSDAVRAAAQRKKYIVGVVAILVAFGLLFCLAPSYTIPYERGSKTGELMGSSSSAQNNNDVQYLMLEEQKEHIPKAHGQKKKKKVEELHRRDAHKVSDGSFLEQNTKLKDGSVQQHDDLSNDDGQFGFRGFGHQWSNHVAIWNDGVKAGFVNSDRAFKPDKKVIKKTVTKYTGPTKGSDDLEEFYGNSVVSKVNVDHNKKKQMENQEGRHSIPKKQHTFLQQRTPAPCDFSKGKWISEMKSSLYTNVTCPWVHHEAKCESQRVKKGQNMHWRWKPEECTVEPFDAKLLLKLLRNKAIGFAGDRMVKSQAQSLLCLLGQVEVPRLIYDDNTNKSMSWRFLHSNVTLIYVFSAHLVQQRSDYIHGAPDGVKKLSLDALDETWATVFPTLDVAVLEVGRAIVEPASYVVRNKLVGCHGCNPKLTNESLAKEISVFSAYRAGLRTAIKGVTNFPGFTGITLFQTFSLVGDGDDHHSIVKKEPVIRRMREIACKEIENAHVRGIPNGSRLELLDVVLLSGNVSTASIHPQPINLNCFPGPSDTWNQFLMHALLNPTMYINISE